MSIRTKIILFTLTALLMFTHLGCKQAGEKNKGVFEPTILTLDQDFSSEDLNDKVLVSTKFREADLNRKNLKAYFLKNILKVERKKSVISLGNYQKHPEAWFYIQVVNAGNTNRNLVIEESNHLRCDALGVYTFNDKGVKKWGQVIRSTPLAERKIPFFVYAVPITINTKDTLNLLIQTQRFHGYHEVSFNVASYDFSLKHILNTFIYRLINVVLVVISMLVLFILGWIFSDRKMLFLSLFLFFIALSMAVFFGFMDWFMIHPNLSVGSMPVLVCFLNASYLPYGLEVMKPVPKNEKWFKAITYTLFVVNILASCCYFLPFNWLHQIETPLILLVWFMVLLSIFWLIYYSFIALIRAKIYYFFGAVCVAIVPFLYEQVIVFFFEEEFALYLRVNLSLWLLAVISIVVLSVFQLIEKLVTRRKYDENLNFLKESTEDVRKTEVETIGRNLHDNVGNILASALGYLSLKTPNTGLSQHLVKEAINEIRFLSHNLVKDEDIPLSVKLEALIGRFNDFSTIVFIFEDFSDGKINQLEKTTQQNIYMITQEVLTNIIKHSKATEAYVQVFERENNTIQITIEDDGIGIQNFAESGGIGLKNINKRAKISNLKLTIDSTPAGTNFIIETPTEL
jgi:signal transduction histidine kinase